MKYRVNLKGRIYEVEVEKGEAMLVDEYEAAAPAAPAPTVSAVTLAAGAAPGAVPAPQAAHAVAAQSSGGSFSVSGTPVTAPLPGNILSIKVQKGDKVKAGEVLVIIEAMKMENEVLAPCDGLVKEVLTSKGAVVATGNILLVI